MVRKIDSVKGNAKFSLTYQPRDTTVKLGQEVALSVFVNEGQLGWINKIHWMPSEGLTCTDCLSPVINTYVS